MHDTYKKDEKTKTNFKAINDELVINKTYLDEKLSKKDGHLSVLETNYNKINLHYNKQSEEEILFQRAVKTTIQVLYDQG